MPDVAVVVEVVHGGLQRGLESVWVILKEPQDDAPNKRSKQREGVVFGLRNDSLFHRQTGQSEEDPGQQVHVDLTIDVVIVSKHQPSSDTGCKEGVGLQALPLSLLLQSLQTLVCEHKVGQVSGMGVCRFQNSSELVL